MSVEIGYRSYSSFSQAQNLCRILCLMFSRLRRFLLFTSLAGICFGQLSTKPVDALFDPNRYAGQDRFETAVLIGNRINTGIRDVVYLTRSDRFADALAAGSLYDGPLLLVPPCGSTRATLSDAIERWNPKKVVAIGGESAVCEETLTALANGRPTSRISGEDRIRTAIAISQYRYPSASPEEVYLATSRDSPDALAIALSNKGPILLVGNQDPPSWLIDEVSRLASEKIVVIGGQQVLPDHVINKLTSNKPFTRLAGSSRYETAVEISKYLYPEESPRDVYLARADTYVDAVAAGMASTNVLLLVPTCGPVPKVVREEVGRLKPSNIIALGGSQAICQQVIDDLVATKYLSGHGFSYPQSGTIWQDGDLSLRYNVPDSGRIEITPYHPSACDLLAAPSTDECRQPSLLPVWSLLFSFFVPNVEGEVGIECSYEQSMAESYFPYPDTTFVGPNVRGIPTVIFADGTWLNPCKYGPLRDNYSQPPVLYAQMSFMNLLGNEGARVSPVIEIDVAKLLGS